MSRRIAFLMLAAASALLACESRASLGTVCTANRECSSPLVCRVGRCRVECAEGRDCPAGQVCLAPTPGAGACELPAIDVCALSCDAPLICVSGHCRQECAPGRDCPTGHVCRAGACERAESGDTGADAAFADAWQACDPVGSGGCEPGQRCGLVAGMAGCVAASGLLALGDTCRAEEECARGLSCQGRRCVRVCHATDTDPCDRAAGSVCSRDSVAGQFTPLAAGIGLCTEICDPLMSTGCPRPHTCSVGIDGRGTTFSWCRLVGTGGVGASCTGSYQCVVGLECQMGSCVPHCPSQLGMMPMCSGGVGLCCDWLAVGTHRVGTCHASCP